MIENKILQVLSNFEIFKGLTGDDIKNIPANCQRLKLKEADILIKEGHLNGNMRKSISCEYFWEM
jgi:hypothetical protein